MLEKEYFEHFDHIKNKMRKFYVGQVVYYLRGYAKGRVISEKEVELEDGTILKSLDTQTHKYTLRPPK